MCVYVHSLGLQTVSGRVGGVLYVHAVWARPHTGKMAHWSVWVYSILIAHSVRWSMALSVAELVGTSLGVIEPH